MTVGLHELHSHRKPKDIGKMKSRYSEVKSPTNYKLQRKPSEYALEILILVFLFFLWFEVHQENQDALNTGSWL